MKKDRATTKFPLKAYNMTELAAIYEMDRRTFKNWIKPFLPEIGEKRGRYYDVNQVQIIINKLGLPENSD